MSGRTAAGASLMIVSRLLTRCIDLATLIILGRLLSPADFGLVAIAMSVMLIIEGVSDLPMFQALIRLPVLKQSHYDTSFTISILRALVLAVLLCTLAWPLSWLYGDHRLIGLLCTLWLAPAGRSLGSPKFVDYFRKFEFRQVLAIEITGKSLAFATSVGLAWWTGSYWAISAGTIIAPVSMSLISYLVAPYRPKLALTEWHEFAGFFGWSTAAQLLNAINYQVDQLILGRFVNAVELGRFSMANNLANLPTQVVIAQVVNPLVVAFSHIRDDRERLATAYQTSAVTMVTIGFPAMIGLSMIAAPSIRLVLGPQWLEAVHILRWLSIAALPYFFVSCLGPLSMALGRTQTFLQLASTELCLRVPLTLPVVAYFGIEGALVLRVTLAVIMALYSMLVVGKLTGLSVLSQLTSPWRSILSGSLMAIVVQLFASWLESLPPFIPLALGLTFVIGVAGLVYAVSLFLLWHLAGRPPGIESRVLSMLSKYYRRFAVR